MSERTLLADSRAECSRDPRLEYWEECLAQSFEEHGVTATREQIAAVANDVEGARDCMNMAFHVPENPLAGELQRAKAALDHEQRLVFCTQCDGSGRDRYHAGPWAVDTQCSKCNGKGKRLP